ncbi:MAG: hypothetical protein ACI8P3_003814 [Saprospiraceae bacterium]|jgi:hypothetical protein
MKTIKIFLASSEELVADRRDFEIFLNRRNKSLIKEGTFLELVIWEDFLDAMSKTRLQDEYNKAIKDADVFILLFYTKIGKYSEEEFNTAYREFQTNGKPLIFTYFKDDLGNVTLEESLVQFKSRLSEMEHFTIVYKNIESLQLHFFGQLEMLKSTGFMSDSSNNKKPSGTPGVSILDTIKKKIASGDSIAKILDKHRNDILALSEDRDMELTMLQSRSSKLEKDVRIGIISSGDAGIERARIMNSFLYLLDDIKSEME